jgi:hypothetical protein
MEISLGILVAIVVGALAVGAAVAFSLQQLQVHNLRAGKPSAPPAAAARAGRSPSPRAPRTPSSSTSPSPSARAAAAWAHAASVAVPAVAYYLTSAPDITLVDSGELVLAAAGPGVAHPAGFPAWTLLAHVATLLPGDPIRNANLVSVACAVATVHCLHLLCRALAKPAGPWEEAGPLAGALLACFAFPVWGTARCRVIIIKPYRS